MMLPILAMIDTTSIDRGTIVSTFNLYSQEIRKRYPSCDGKYRDYTSTFEAESAMEL